MGVEGKGTGDSAAGGVRGVQGAQRVAYKACNGWRTRRTAGGVQDVQRVAYRARLLAGGQRVAVVG